MTSDDFFTFKNLAAMISAPLTFLLGLAGWHYKNIYTKVEETADQTNQLQVLVHEHNIHVNHLNNSVNKLEDKIDMVIKKLAAL